MPDASANVYGALPPLAESACKYGVPVNPAGKGDTLVIVTGVALTVSVNVLSAMRRPKPVVAGVSRTPTVNVNVPADGAVPLSTPVELIAKPAGNVPETNPY